MNVMKKSLALLLVFALALSCFPLGAVTAFAAENEETQPPSEPADTTPTEVTETQPPTETKAPTEATTPESEPAEETAPFEELSEEEHELSLQRHIQRSGQARNMNYKKGSVQSEDLFEGLEVEDSVK